MIVDGKVMKFIVKIIGEYKGVSKINHGTFAGQYEVYEFLGGIYELPKEE